MPRVSGRILTPPRRTGTTIATSRLGSTLPSPRFLMTDEFDRDYERMAAAGVRFTEALRDEQYERGTVFEDLYGNRWDVLQQRHAR